MEAHSEWNKFRYETAQDEILKCNVMFWISSIVMILVLTRCRPHETTRGRIQVYKRNGKNERGKSTTNCPYKPHYDNCGLIRRYMYLYKIATVRVDHLMKKTDIFALRGWRVGWILHCLLRVISDGWRAQSATLTCDMLGPPWGVSLSYARLVSTDESDLPTYLHYVCLPNIPSLVKTDQRLSTI